MKLSRNRESPSSEIGATTARKPGIRHWARAVSCLAAIAAFAAAAGPGQYAPGAPPHYSSPGNSPDANAQMQMRQQQSKQKSFEAANIERKKQITEDSALLLKLAADLKAEVDKTTKDTLSIGVIRKAGEIERLAHAVKEKMKLTVSAN